MVARAVRQPLRNIFNRLRLSDYETRVYELLLSEGPSTAMRISVLSNVPRTKVYKTLKRLVEMGMVSEIPLKPKQFFALPPKETLKPILEAHRATQRSLYTLISNLQKRYEKSMSLINIVREEVWILTGPDVLEKASRFLSQAEKKVNVFASSWDAFSKFHRLFGEVLNGLAERKVVVNLYFPEGSGVDQRFFCGTNLHCKIVDSFVDFSSQLILLSLDRKHAAACLLTDEDKPFTESSVIWIIFRGRTLCGLAERILIKGSMKPSLLLESPFVTNRKMSD